MEALCVGGKCDGYRVNIDGLRHGRVFQVAERVNEVVADYSLRTVPNEVEVRAHEYRAVIFKSGDDFRATERFVAVPFGEDDSLALQMLIANYPTQHERP